MEITITTRPAGSEQRAASSRRSSSQQHRPFWQNRDVGLFGPSLEALKLLFPRIHHLMFSLFCGKSLLNPPDCFYTADPRNQLEIKKNLQQQHAQILLLVSLVPIFSVLTSLFYCVIELLSIVDADAHILHSINVSILTTENYTVHQTLHHLQIL